MNASRLFLLVLAGCLLVLSSASVRAAAQDGLPAALPAEAPAAPPALLPPPPAAPAPPAHVVPSAAEVAWQELHALQDQEAQLWSERGRYGLGLPITGVVLGIPMFAILVPMGGILVADSRYASGSCYSSSSGSGCDNYDDGSKQERAIGRTLLAFGVLGAIAIGVGAYSLAKIRRKRQSDDNKLESLSGRRTLLEHVLEGQFRSAGVSF